MFPRKRKNYARKCLKTGALILLYFYLAKLEYLANRKLAAKFDFRSAELLLVFQSSATILVLHFVFKWQQISIPRLNLLGISTFFPFTVLLFISAKCGILVFKSRGILETSPFKICIFPLSLEMEKVLFHTNIFLITRLASLGALFLSFLCYVEGGEVTYGWLQCVVSRATFAVFVNGMKKILLEAENNPLYLLYGVYLLLLLISIVLGIVSFSVFDGLRGPPWLQGEFLYTLILSILFGIGYIFTQVYLTYFTSPTFVVVLTYAAQASWNLGNGDIYAFSCRIFVIIAIFVALFSFLLNLIYENLPDVEGIKLPSLS